MYALIIACIVCLLATGAPAQTAQIVPREAIAAALRQNDCETTDDEAIEDATTYDLDRNLKIVEVPCWHAAYNDGSLVFMVDPRRPSEARLMQFRNWSHDTKKWEPTSVLWNVEYKPKTKQLISFDKFRGIADCGSSGQYTWSGSEFKLTGFWVKEDCDGTDFKPGGARWRIYP